MCTADTLAYPAAHPAGAGPGRHRPHRLAFVADEIGEEFGVDADRIVVVPYGVNALARRDGDGTDAAAGRRLAGADPFVLAIGTVEPRKDLPSLVRAFDGLAPSHPDLHLVIAGPDGWGADALDRAIAGQPARRRIQRPGVGRATTSAPPCCGPPACTPTRRSTRASGCPPIEAMAAGTPVVTTRVGSLPEVVGDAAAARRCPRSRHVGRRHRPGPRRSRPSRRHARSGPRPEPHGSRGTRPRPDSSLSTVASPP